MVKNLFIAAAALGLVINLYSDFTVFNQSKLSLSTGQWVEHGYQIAEAIDAVRIALLESQLQKAPTQALSDSLQKLSTMTQELPTLNSQVENLLQWTPQELVTAKSTMALSVLSHLEAAEEALLSVRIQEDRLSNSTTMFHTMYANIFDIFLILLFVVFFFYERRAALRLQRSLATTLLDVDANNQRLQFALAQKKAQLKIAVHDLKNPLGSIRGFAELICDEAAGKNSIMEMAQVIQRVSNNSLSLVHELLNDGDESSARTELVDVLECLQETCKFLSPIAQEKSQKIRLEANSSPFVLTAPKRQIQDVFFNVVGNALKFSPKGSSIIVESIENERGHEVWVKDAGPGFTQSDFQKLFKEGSRLSAQPTGGEVSTGLGLYSVKQNLDRIGADIQAANLEGGGAVMKIRFPHAPPPPRS